MTYQPTMSPPPTLTAPTLTAPALASPALPALLRTRSEAQVTDGSRWVEDACAIDRRVLARATGPVLDIGCGPGRHAAELSRRGIASLGIDITPAAVEVARARGATVLERSVFDDLPGTGTWATALLLDGNIGIGGDPVCLLERVHDLLGIGGSVIVEVTGPGGCRAARYVSFEVGGSEGPGFWFAGVCADCLGEVASAAGFVVQERWVDSGRSFAHLRRAPLPVDGGPTCN